MYLDTFHAVLTERREGDRAFSSKYYSEQTKIYRSQRLFLSFTTLVFETKLIPLHENEQKNHLATIHY